MIKLIASDLDGTLLKEGSMDINPEIYDIIRKLKAKGIVFAAVSGREYDSIERVFAPVKDDIYFIAGNGGIISYQGEIIEKMAIYLAERSCEKSVPVFSHKVDKPQNIEKALGKVKEGLILEDMKNNVD